MAVTSLTNSPNYPGVFRRRVLANTQYWQDYVTEQAAAVATLDRERNRIIKAISFALNHEDAWPDVHELIVTFAPYMERRGHWETWNWLLNRAVKAAQQANDVTRAITLSALLARLLQRQSQPKQAIAYYRQTIRMARQTGNRFEEGRACTNLGYFYIEQGYWYRAEVLCCHALNIFERMDNSHGRAHTENHLGILYLWQDLWDKARQHLDHACTIWQSKNDRHGLMYGFLNLGLLHVKMGRPNEALSYSEKALHQARLTGEELEIGKIYMNIGLAYKLRGELSKAETYNRQAETIF